jgi:hypothetical protein
MEVARRVGVIAWRGGNGEREWWLGCSGEVWKGGEGSGKEGYIHAEVPANE